MASVTKGKRSFSPIRMLDHAGAYAYSAFYVFSALGSGSPVIQMAAAALLPGAHMGIRATLRAITGTPQMPMGRLTRIYSVGAASVMTPLVNFPDLVQGVTHGSYLYVATGLGAGLTMAYASTVATSKESLAGKSWLKDLDKDLESGASPEASGQEMESIFDLSADRCADAKATKAASVDPGATASPMAPARVAQRDAVLGAAKLQPIPPKLNTAASAPNGAGKAEGQVPASVERSPVMSSLRDAIAMDILDTAFGGRDGRSYDPRPVVEHGQPR